MPQEPDEANEVTMHLSEAELRDLVVACVPAHDSEALFLVTRLEEAGIPVSQINAGFRYPGTSPDLRVPRLLLGKAQEEIARAREDVKRNALENAYSTEDVDVKDLEKDPILAEMAALCSLPMEEKRGELIQRTIHWFSTGRTDTEIARYLAVAGLSQEETHELVRSIMTLHQAHFKVVQTQYRHMGFALIGFGLLLLITAVTALNTHRLAMSGGFIGVFLGMAVLYGASKKPQQSALTKDVDEGKN